MKDAEHGHHREAETHSGCGCSAKAAPPADKPAASSCCGGHGDHAHHHAHKHDEAAKILDPVCGMTVDRAKTPHRSRYGARTVYFCSSGCKASFDAAPERYVDRPGRDAASRAS